MAIEDFNKRLEALDTAQTDVENNINLEKLEENVEAAADFRQQVRLPLIRAAQLLDHLNAADEDKGSVHSSAGDVTEWQSFLYKFVAIIDTPDLPDKQIYLPAVLISWRSQISNPRFVNNLRSLQNSLQNSI